MIRRIWRGLLGLGILLIPGTLMPSFATTLTDVQRADHVAFLRAGATAPDR